MSECLTLSSMDWVFRKSYSWHIIRFFEKTDVRGAAYNEDNSAKVAGDLQVTLVHLFAERHNNSASLSRCEGALALPFEKSPETPDLAC